MYSSMTLETFTKLFAYWPKKAKCHRESAHQRERQINPTARPGWAERVQGQTAPRPEHRCHHRHTIKKNETKKTSSEPRTRPSKRVGWRPFPQRQQTIGKKKENVKIQNREKGGEKKQNKTTKPKEPTNQGRRLSLAPPL